MNATLLRQITDQRRIGDASFAAVIALAFINDQCRGIGTGLTAVVARLSRIKMAIAVQVRRGQVLEWLEDTGNRRAGNEVKMHVGSTHVAVRGP